MMKTILMTIAVAVATTAGAYSLHYTAPAADSDKGWETQSLPIGCGHFGVNVFGGVANERLQVTHNAVHKADVKFASKACLTDALEVRVEFPHGEASGYRRGLDLETATAWVEYVADGVKFRREYLASYPARVLAMRFTASKPGALAFRLRPYAPFLKPYGTVLKAKLDGGSRADGRRAETTVGADTLEVYQELEALAIRFASEFKVLTDGKVEKGADALSVSGATEATVIAAFDTNYRLLKEVFLEADWQKKLDPAIDPRPAAKKLVAAAAAKGWKWLQEEHERDVSLLFDRVSIDLGADPADAAVPTDELLKRYREGKRSTYLEELYCQFGRYLLIASSRPGTLPANLQGVWNCHEHAPWGSGYWHNINVQMNYWPAFSGNLAECFLPYADYNEAFRAAKGETCRKFLEKYAPWNLPKKGEEPSDWWTVAAANYPCVTLGGEGGGHDGPGIGGLTTRLFTDWWEFTRSKEALARGFAALHGLAAFTTRAVVETNGSFLAVMSASPEQYVEGQKWTWETGGPPYYHTIGCACDQQLIWENAKGLLDMARELGTNDALVATVRGQFDRYDPVQIGVSGQIKEFREENAFGEIGEKQHRHISQLMGLMPGTLINRTTPEWLAAARKTLELRGDRSTGWALAHRLNAWARVGDGEHCRLLLGNLLGERTYDNLWDAHPPFQIDGNFGGTAGIIEMLVQSQSGRIDLLPALPKAWAKKGSFRGLCVRGGWEVDCAWRDGRPVSVKLVKKVANAKPLKVYFDNREWKAVDRRPELSSVTPCFRAPKVEGLAWHEIRGKDVEGRLFDGDLAGEFDRVPASFTNALPHIWSLGQSASGMCFEFESDTSAVGVRISLDHGVFGEPNFNQTAFAGVDLYVFDDGRWRWAAATHHRDGWAKEMEYGLLWNLPYAKRRYRLYLPMRNRVKAVSVGVDPDADFALAAPRKNPLVYYGTSIAHGAYQTRAGLGVPQILGRQLDVPVANFSFSGSACCEKEVAELIAGVGASMYVLDPYHNMSTALAEKNLAVFCSLLCERNPKTPVVLLGAPHLANGWLWPDVVQKYKEKSAAFERIGSELAAKYANFSFLDGRRFYDGEVSPDGIHANDAAFDRMARMLRPLLRKRLLDSGAIRPKYPNGALLLTYDDRHFADWEAAMKLFAKYGAHASFFPCGGFATNELRVLRKLKDAGHTVGIHSLTHANMPEAFEKDGADAVFERQFLSQMKDLATVGIFPRSIGYPNNRHSALTDDYLVRRGFRHFRAGRVVRYDRNRQHPAVEWAAEDDAFFPAEDLPNRVVLEGLGTGDSYRTDVDDVCRAIRRAAANGEALVTFSHDIAAHPAGISTYTAWLERILATAAACGMPVIGFDEL